MKSTINDITSESAWKKTSQFIEEKYGKKIEFRFLTSLSNQSDRTYIQGDDLIISLNYKQTNLGQVVIQRGALLTMEQKSEAIDLVQFLIEPQAYNRMLKLQLSPAGTDVHENTGNVIRLFSRNISAIDDVHIIDDENKRRLISKFIHVKAKSNIARHKVAYKIHELTGTIVFLRLQDLTDGKVPMTHEMDLADTAIYVENINELNQNQFDLLERLSRKNMSGNSVIIVGSNLNEDQIHHLNCSLAMKTDLLALSYDADRVPLSQQASEEILDLLFFNDDDIIS